MDDKQLSAALVAHRRAWDQYYRDPADSRKEPVLSAQAQTAVSKLLAEAGRVRDPGGPIANYGRALHLWAEANHPEIGPSEMYWHVENKLLFDAR